jgi:hypothetical protein
MRTIKLLCLVLSLTTTLALAGCSVHTQKSADGGDNNKNVDIETPVGNLHVGKDVDVRDAGLAIYPGAKLKDKKDDGDDQSANLSIMTSAFGMKVVAADYVSDDASDKVAAYYKGQLKKFGTVLECHTDKMGNNHMDVNSENDDHASDPVTCGGSNNGSVLELKVGTQNNQRLVSISPQGKGTEFSLVYVRLRGKQGDI